MAQQALHRDIFAPHNGFQKKFVMSNVDVVVGGSAMGVGKTFGALLMAAQPSTDPNFKMVCLRKNLNDTKVGGGMTDDARFIYSDMGATLKMSESPRLSFPNGAFIDFTHMADETPDKVLERVKGWQYDCVYLDEGTGFEWTTFKTIFSRVRGKANWTGKIRITTNPKKSHWLRKWVDWYIDPLTGKPIPERDGKVRYFYIKGDKIEDVVEGNTAEEVYSKCRYEIDDSIRAISSSESKRQYTYKDFVKTKTFYGGRLSENTDLRSDYVGNIAAMGEKQRQANLEQNWNVDPDEDEHIPITSKMAQNVFMNDAAVNGDKWVTMDIADVGTDNAVILAWNGFHVIDIDIIMLSTPKENAQRAKAMAARHGVADCNIVYDATAARYFNDYIEDAIPYISGEKSKGMDAFTSLRIKDACYRRLVSMIKRGQLTFSDEVAQRIYTHQNLKLPITVQSEFLEECSVVRFIRMQSGKDTLMTKKQMNSNLGKNRSMDLLDPCAMRMYPTLYLEYGEELADGFKKAQPLQEDNTDDWGDKTNVNIYDTTLWA